MSVLPKPNNGDKKSHLTCFGSYWWSLRVKLLWSLHLKNQINKSLKLSKRKPAKWSSSQNTTHLSNAIIQEKWSYILWLTPSFITDCIGRDEMVIDTSHWSLRLSSSSFRNEQNAYHPTIATPIDVAEIRETICTQIYKQLGSRSDQRKQEGYFPASVSFCLSYWTLRAIDFVCDRSPPASRIPFNHLHGEHMWWKYCWRVCMYYQIDDWVLQGCTSHLVFFWYVENEPPFYISLSCVENPFHFHRGLCKEAEVVVWNHV